MVLELLESELELVQAEAESFASRVQNRRARETYQKLKRAARQGAIQEDLLEPLGGMLEIGLSSGRIRAIHGAHAEMAAVSVYQRTPQGKNLHSQFSEANRALSFLKDQKIEKVFLSARGPGIYSLSLTTSQCRIVVSLKPSGIEVRSVEVSLE